LGPLVFGGFARSEEHLAAKNIRTKGLFPFAREETSPARPQKFYRRRLQLDASPPAASESCYQGDNKYHQENEKQEFGNSCRRNRNTTKTKDRGDDRNDQKYQRPIEHAASYVLDKCPDSKSGYASCDGLTIRPTLYFTMRIAVGKTLEMPLFSHCCRLEIVWLCSNRSSR
jgi:hypothetical protein